MSTTVEVTRAITGVRLVVGIAGVAAVVVGVVILAWPQRSAMVVTALIAMYAIVAGVGYAALGLFAADTGGRATVGRVVLGIVFLGAGILALMNLSQTTAWLAMFLAYLVGILWIVQGTVALSAVGSATSKVWAVGLGVLSIGAGVLLLFSPMWGIVALWWMLGLSLLVLGVVNLVGVVWFGKEFATR